MKIGAAFPSKYLKAVDLQGRSFQVQITGLRVEDVGTEGKPEHKPVLYLSYQGRPAEKPMVLNRTNADTIAMDLGDETDTWVGHTIELFSMRVQGPNGMTDGIRCRVIHPQEVRQPAPVPTGFGGTAAGTQAPYVPVGLTPQGNIPPSSAFRPPAAEIHAPFGGTPTPGGYGAVDPNDPPF